MLKKEALFVLIHSLSKAEKRYFTVSCRQSDAASNYLKLFEAIDSQKEYDEAAIRKKFRKELFCKQLHVTKNYLRQLIYKSLRQYHSKISKDAELKEVLRNVEILYHKELYVHCEGELKKAERIARDFELNSGLAEVTAWKRKLAQATNSHQYDRFAALLAEQEEAIAAMLATNLHWQHAVRISHVAVSSNRLATQPESAKAGLQNAHTLESKVLYYNASYLSALRNGLQDKAEQWLQNLLQLLETYPHRMQEDPALYISSANNLVSFFVFTKQYDKAIELINRSRQLYENAMQQYEKRSLLKQLLRTYNIELEIYRDTKTYEQHLSLIKKVAGFITRHDARIPVDYLVSFWFQLANIHFMRRDFNEALKWINHILNASLKDTRIDLQLHARMLNLMIHLEQDNLFVLRYFVDSTRRFMKKTGQGQPLEQQLLNFFSKIGQTPAFERKDKFKELHTALFVHETANLQAPILDYVDYKSWIERKCMR